METINSLAQTASNAIFGQKESDTNHQEPISGVKGDTAHGEPYDAGNIEPQPNTNKSEDTSSSSTSNPSKEKPSSVPHIKDSTKGQADTRHPDNPETAPGTSTAKNDVDNKQDEAKPLGPGPRPLAEVAKENGGDAGTSNTSVDRTPSADDVDLGGEPYEAMGQTIKPLVSPASHSGPRASGGSGSGSGPTGGGGAKGEEGPQKESHGEGTGEKYEKSTGLAAEGGDFDATRPGAGREADRLLGEKGIKRTGNADSKNEPETSLGHESNPGEKKSLKDKIKDKLHKH